MVTALDRNIGRVLDAVEKAGLEENTIVAFLSDNGGPAPDAAPHSRNMADNGPLRESSEFLCLTPCCIADTY